MKIRSLPALAVIFLATGLAAGCSSSSPGNSPSGAGGTAGSDSGQGTQAAAKAAAAAELKPTKIIQNVPLVKPPSRGKSVIFIDNGESGDAQVYQAIQAAARSLGWNASSVVFDPANPATLDQALNTALVKHPYMVIEPGTGQNLISSSVLSAYAAAKVPILISAVEPCTVTATIIGCTSGLITYQKAGVALANWFIADSRGRGQAIVVHLSAFPILGGFSDGFEGQVSKSCSSCAVKEVDVTVQQLAAGQIAGVVATALKAHPSYKYVVFDNGPFADGITSALSAAGLTDIKIGGVQPDKVALAALQTGREAAWVAASTYYQGYEAMDAAARWSVGMGSTSSVALDQAAPEQLLTSANIGTTSNWNQPANALSQFEALWKVPATQCTLGCD